MLYSKDETFLRNIHNLEEVKHLEEINGENNLSVTTSSEVYKKERFMYKDTMNEWHEFIIDEIDILKENGKMKYQIYAEHSIYETFGDYIELLDIVESGGKDMLGTVLGPSRWKAGKVTVQGIQSHRFEEMSVREAIQVVAQLYKAELQFRIERVGDDIINRYVDLVPQRGYDLGKRFTYSKDLLSVSKKVHQDNVVTALYGYGKELEPLEGEEDLPRKRLTFEEVNRGVAYVGDTTSRDMWGRGPVGSKKHIFDKVIFEECEDPEELLVLTTKALDEVKNPKVSYEAKVIDLKALGFEHEGVSLGDVTVVIDKEFKPALRIKSRIIRMEKDLLTPTNNQLLFGNFTANITQAWSDMSEWLEDFRNRSHVWDRAEAINPDGSIDAEWFNNLVEALNQEMNARGGYVYISDQGDGIMTLDTPKDGNPTMAIQIKGGMFRIAANKLPNGEWNWRTFGDGHGFYADAFVGGVLKGGQVEFDLTMGTLLIGNSVADHTLWFDGNTLSIKIRGKTMGEIAQEKADAARNSAKAYADEQDTITLNNAKLDAATKADAAEDAAKLYAETKAEAARVTAEANADGKITAEEAARIKDVNAKLALAKADAKTKADAALVAAKDYAEVQDAIVLSSARSDAKEKADIAEDAAKLYAETKAEAARITAEAHADGIVTAEEAARIKDVNAKLALAKADAKTKADAAKDAAQQYADEQDIAILKSAKSDATAKANSAKTAAEKYARTQAEAAKVEASAWADGIVTAEEQKRIDDVNAKLALAKKDSKEKADAARDAAKNYADAQDKVTLIAAKADAKKKADDAAAAAAVYTRAQAEAARITAEAHADGIVTAEEQARIDDVNAKLALAKTDAQTKANAARDSAKDYAYAQDVVRANEVVSSINVKPSSIKIDTKNLNLSGNLNLRGRFTNYDSISGRKAVEMSDSKIDFYDYDGSTRKTPVGTIFSSRSGGETLRVGTAFNSEANAAISIGYALGTGYSDYMTFNKDGNTNGYPISVRQPMALVEDARVFGDKRLRFGGGSNLYEDGAKLIIRGHNNNGFQLGSALAGQIIDWNPATLGTYPIALRKSTAVLGYFKASNNALFDRNLVVSGSKNSLQKTDNYGSRLINAYETAGYYFGDIGSGVINQDGECVVYIEAIFKETINTDMVYHVFTQKYNGDITSIERNKKYFIVKGEVGTEFSWEIKAKRKGYEHHRLEVQGTDDTVVPSMLANDNYSILTAKSKGTEEMYRILDSVINHNKAEELLFIGGL